MKKIPEYWQWFDEARFGLFIHWGAYAAYGRGEQVLNRERLDHRQYSEAACRWQPEHYDPAVWATVARGAGMKYAVFGARHHDGYCLWDTQHTDYSTACQAPRRDFVREYVEAFRAAGLRVGLYYSLIDLRVPAWLDGPQKDPDGWARIKAYVFDQVRELLTNYGKLDVIWFDGLWPRSAAELDSRALIAMIRELQPEILINDRLEWPQYSWHWQFPDHPGVPDEIGDFGTPEQGIYAKPGYLWESCQTANWRHWGYAHGEHWKSAVEILDLLVECANRAGNLLLNVGPQADGRLPPQFVERVTQIGDWLALHGEAIYGCERGDITEFTTHGWQTVQGNNLYLILRFYAEPAEVRTVGLESRVERATLLSNGQQLPFEQRGDELIISGLPALPPNPLFPVIKLECSEPPRGGAWSQNRIWGTDASGFSHWAAQRGTSVWADGKER